MYSSNTNAPLLRIANAILTGHMWKDNESESDLIHVAAMRSLRILLVDDDPSIREHLSDFLNRVDGHTVETAVDGMDGLQCFNGGSWDLVLVDRAMPRMNGFELAGAIKERAPHTPVIMISGVPGLAARGQELEVSVDAFLPKPFTSEELSEAIESAARKCSGT